jgi:serine/threonine protein kinase/Tfp pilus assembly protein PilF
LDAARFQRIKKLLAEASSLAITEREAFLDRECGADQALRRDLEELFTATHLTPSSPVLPSLSSAAPGKEIGPFELIERLGEGGMGTVWRARQSRPVRREVALKLLRSGLDSPEAIARFETERQALALMDHDCIAKVYEAGATEDGFPYFAMEYVRGLPITAHCDKYRLTIPERLELFAHVCAGVQHAHQKAIIHRDLKPSNILVAGEGASALPKIIDFGVAKALGARLTDHTMVTYHGTLLGTPEYMSPEQVESTSVEVDTRADVYALGVLLYELLTGSVPFDSKRLRAAGYDGIRRILREEEPPTLSARLDETEPNDVAIIAARRKTEPAMLIHVVKDDLDWIVMKAMDKQPGRRYESASQLAEDLRRHLANEPVMARPPSTAYRLSKFLRRNRAAAAITATVATLVVVFGAIMAVQAARISKERDRAQSEARRAEAVSSYVLDLFASSDPTTEEYDEAEAEAAHKMLMRGLENAESLADQPEAQADMLGGIGMTLLHRGFPEDAHEVLERAREVRPDASDEVAARNLLMLGRAKMDLGEYAEASSLLVRSIALEDSLHSGMHSDQGTARRWLGELRRIEKKYDEAEKLLREASDIQRKTQGPEDLDYATTISSLSHVMRMTGRLEECLALLQETKRIQEKVLGPRHADVAVNMLNIAGVLRELGRKDEAEPLYKDALQMHREMFGETSASTAIAYNNYGVFLRETGKPKESIPLLEKAVAISEETSGRESPGTARYVSNLGRACTLAGDPVTGERYLRRALNIQSAIVPETDTSIAAMRADLGESLMAQKRYADAERELLKSQQTFEAAKGADHDLTKKAVERLVRLYDEWKKADSAATWRSRLAA